MELECIKVDFTKGYDDSILFPGFNLISVKYVSTQVLRIYLNNLQDAIDLIQWSKKCEFVRKAQINNTCLKLGIKYTKTKKSNKKSIYNIGDLIGFFKKFITETSKVGYVYYMDIYINHESKDSFNRLFMDWCNEKNLLRFTNYRLLRYGNEFECQVGKINLSRSIISSNFVKIRLKWE